MANRSQRGGPVDRPAPLQRHAHRHLLSDHSPTPAPETTYLLFLPLCDPPSPSLSPLCTAVQGSALKTKFNLRDMFFVFVLHLENARNIPS